MKRESKRVLKTPLVDLNHLEMMADPDEGLSVIGRVANRAAAVSVFERYHLEQSEATVKRHGQSLGLFGEFLMTAADEFGVSIGSTDFQHDPAAWGAISWGLVQAFKTWMLNEGYAIGTINKRLDAVRVYSRMAHQAGFVTADEMLKIKAVKGIAYKTAKNVNKNREKVRVGHKKEAAVRIDPMLETALRYDHPETPAGRRNGLIMALMLDHGLRASEVVLVSADSFDLAACELSFYRPKTKDMARQKMTPATVMMLMAYRRDWPKEGRVFVGSYKDGRLRPENPLTEITLGRLVNRLGKRHGVPNLSPHDCRHHCATYMAKRGYDVKRLMDWFGWTSPAMAVRYIAGQVVQERDLG